MFASARVRPETLFFSGWLGMSPFPLAQKQLYGSYPCSRESMSRIWVRIGLSRCYESGAPYFASLSVSCVATWCIVWDGFELRSVGWLRCTSRNSLGCANYGDVDALCAVCRGLGWGLVDDLRCTLYSSYGAPFRHLRLRCVCRYWCAVTGVLGYAVYGSFDAALRTS